MRILVTGVAGFIGSNLAKQLLREGYGVIGIDNFSHGCVSNMSDFCLNSNFCFIEGDLRKRETLNVNCDIVVHLASQKIPRYTNAFNTLDDNNMMIKNIIDKCRKDKIKLVFSSTSDVYGKNKNIPFNEESDLVLGNTKVKRWAYAVSKIYSEHYIIANHEEFGLDYTIMRFFGSYGQNQNTTWWGGAQSVFIQNILEDKKIEIHGDGSQTRTFSYIDDTVDGIIKCMFSDKAKNEIFNIAGEANEEISVLNLGNLIWKLMRGESSADIKYIPYSAFGNYEDVKRRVPDISKIKNLLYYNPKYSLEEGIRKTIKWQTDIFNAKKIINQTK